MANNNGNNSIIDLSADGICEYSYALYNCEYCGVKTFLSMEMNTMMTTPADTKPGALLVRTNKRTGKEVRRSVACSFCLKHMSYMDRKWGKDTT